MHVNVLSILMHMRHGSPIFISDASSFLILGLKLRVLKNVYDVRVKSKIRRLYYCYYMS